MVSFSIFVFALWLYFICSSCVFLHPHFLWNQKQKIDPAGYIRNKQFELFSFMAWWDLQLIYVIAPGEKFDYSHEKSERTVMRESLSQTVHGSWVCIHSIVEMGKKLQRDCFRMWIDLERSQGRWGRHSAGTTSAAWYRHVCLSQLCGCCIINSMLCDCTPLLFLAYCSLAKLIFSEIIWSFVKSIKLFKYR